MKVKMIKMGSDYTTPINCRMRGIVVTEDNKHLFVEIGCAYSPKIKNTSLSENEYNLKYPNPEYVSVDFCFRVDIPEEFYNNRSKGYSKYTRENLFEIPYTKEGIIKFLQKLNKNIDDIELVDDYYIDEYCKKNGFFELYDDRLEHTKKIIEIKDLSPILNDNSLIEYQYTCYAANGTEYSEIRKTRGKIRDIIEEYGKENVRPLAIEYVKRICDIFNNDKIKEKYNDLLNEAFGNDKADLLLDIEDEYTDI